MNAFEKSSIETRVSVSEVDWEYATSTDADGPAVASRIQRLSLVAGLLFVELAGLTSTLIVLYEKNYITVLLGALMLLPLLLFSIDFAMVIASWIVPLEVRIERKAVRSMYHDAAVDLVPIAVPVLIRGANDIEAALCCLRENLALNDSPRVEFVLLADFSDAGSMVMKSDEDLRLKLDDKIHKFNQSGERSNNVPCRVFYRRRRWNEFDKIWMGWERKRGKVLEFLKFVRGEPNSYDGECPRHWRACKYVFIIDVDSRVRGDDVLLMAAELEDRRASTTKRRPVILAPTLETLECPRDRVDRWLSEPKIFAGTRDWREPTLRQHVLRNDLYNGKGLLAIDDFISLSKQISDNSILSHDHLESILGAGCSTHEASVFEPFPLSRRDWERREHRWVRGDFQVLPWLFNTRGKALERDLDLGDRAAILQILFKAFNPVVTYAAVLAGFMSGAVNGIIVVCLLVSVQRQSIVLSVAQLPFFILKGVHRNGALRTTGYLLTNGALRTLGSLIYLQRNALLSFDAMCLSLIRMLRPGRAKLLEWYPSNPNRSILARRRNELFLVALCGALRLSGAIGFGLFEAVTMWLIVPGLVTRLPSWNSSMFSPHRLQ
jgi:cyclic beta-1,2-glucan synthetase